jgi:mannose-6-phosphate isomerase-like protein (cupin superfamily)
VIPFASSRLFLLTLGSPAGKGYCSNAASGVQQALWPGDSIISLHGAATFAAGPLPNQDPKQQDSTTLQQASSPAWSQLLGWLQHLHTKQQHSSGALPSPLPSSPAAAAGAAAGQHGSSNQLVMLQLLLPSELLTGEMLSHHAGHGLAVAEQLPWGPASLKQSAGGVSLHGLAAAGSIHEAEVCGLLVDGGLGSPEAQSTQQSMQEDQQQQAQEQQQHPVQFSSNRNGSSGSSSGGDGMSAHILPGLDQQQISKRALSEVGAFRLPQQTNRLALLFGPHCSPAVCCSFGVEVFEPGHVTPLHIHNTAHELFFVLAGKGEAVFKAAGGSGQNGDGPDSRQPQRVPVSPGDVAVFAPGVVHGVDNASGSQLYCLQMMLPNEFFVEFVRSGEEAGRLDVTAVQRIAAAASCG